MVTYFVQYEAENHYEEVVTEALLEFLVLPCQDATQLVSNIKMTNSLQSDFFWGKTAFDYEAVCFRSNRPFQHLQFSVSCHVRKNKSSIFSGPFLSVEEELSILHSDEFKIDHYLYLQPTVLTELLPEKLITRFLYHEDKPLIQFLRELNETIYQVMTYRPGVTTPQTRAIEILEKPEGVCQDYSHLMLGVLRHHGIPCRYVSGYLNQGQAFIGSAQMHAWVEALIPQFGWVGLDPTNNLLVEGHHIKVADGLDYEDCSPLKGFIRTKGLNRTHHTVKVVEQQ